MKKLYIMIFAISLLFLSCVTTTSTDRTGEAIFSTEEYAVGSFKKNSNSYLLTFISIEDSVPDNAMILITVNNSGEGRPFEKGKKEYQFGNLNIPETGEFDIEFGIGIPEGNQMKVRSKTIFRSITTNDIQQGLEIDNGTSSQEMEFVDYTGKKKTAELFKRINGENILDSTGFLEYFNNDSMKNYARLTMENINNPKNNTETEYSFMSNGTLESAQKVSSNLRNQAFYFPVREPRLIVKQIDANNHMTFEGIDYDLQLIANKYDLTQDDINLYYSRWGNSISYDAIIVNSYNEGILGIVGVGNFVDKWDGGGNPDMDSFTYIFYIPEN